MKNRQAAHQVEKAFNKGAKKEIKHKGHKLKNGEKGSPHYQTPDETGHTFWSGIVGVLGALLDPFSASDAADGELPDYSSVPKPDENHDDGEEKGETENDTESNDANGDSDSDD